jgi:hypothetical protein
MTNKWQESASLFANMGACFINQKCKIEEYFVEYPDETPVLLYYGVMDAPRMTVSQFQIDVIRTLGDYQAESPNMTYDVNCQFRLGDTRCRYSGTETFCDGTLSNCVALGNTLRFGGHPSIPREMVIR